MLLAIKISSFCRLTIAFSKLFNETSKALIIKHNEYMYTYVCVCYCKPVGCAQCVLTLFTYNTSRSCFVCSSGDQRNQTGAHNDVSTGLNTQFNARQLREAQEEVVGGASNTHIHTYIIYIRKCVADYYFLSAQLMTINLHVVFLGGRSTVGQMAPRFFILFYFLLFIYGA